MKSFLRKHIVLFSTLLILSVIGLTYFVARDTSPVWTTDTVSKGSVRNIISVSGVVDAVSTAELAFSTGGIIESIAVHEGDIVAQGQTLATLSHNDVKADYQDAQAAVLIAQADRNELVNGIRSEERDVAKTNLDIAKEDLARITKEQNDKVANALRTLLSSDLEARPAKSDNDDTPPTVAGTYTCAEGLYTLDVFSSSARSGYSYRLTGLEEGTYTAYTEAPSLLGKCGLTIQFYPNVSYGGSKWIIDIPNTQDASYVINRNAYSLAVIQRDNAIHEAEQKLTLAQQNNTLENATPRAEALSRAEAKVLQAEARRSAVEAQIQDHILTAPFPGTVTNIEPVSGEAVGTEPVITMASDESFALTALIPEIDVTKIVLGQKADVVFDARQEETLRATITFISPLAKEVDGVSYFEAKFILDNPVTWIKSGLNADVDIIIDIHENVTRIPKRYLKEENGTYSVLTPREDEAIPVPVSVVYTGNDGFVEISGIEQGTTIIAP